MGEAIARWRIKEFSGRVGVPEATLRAWEQRYGLLDPERTAGRFRLYTPADEQRIHTMQAHMSQGVSPAQAAAMALANAPVVAQAADLVESLLEAMSSYDTRRFDALLDVSFSLGRLEAIRDVILPTLFEVGVRWANRELSVGHEHFATHLIEQRLLRLTAGWGRGTGPLALLACPSGEQHTLGLVCFGLTLADGGWRVEYLGANTPIDQVAEAGASLAPDVVILCALDSDLFTDREADLAALSARHRTVLARPGADAALAARLGVECAPENPVVAAQALRQGPR